jgi:hypothetical protein
MPAPRFLGYQALLGEPKPINWQGIGQALWETNLNSPIRGAYNLMNTPYDVLAGGPSPEMDQAVADSFDAAGGVTVGSLPMPKPANSLTMGIKAYHGSPHSFDKFSMDKIGTGEGAQAYGHGLYFAENEGVAKGYRDQITGSAVTCAQRELKKANGDVDGAIAAVQAEIDRLKNLSLNENTGAGKRDQMMQFKTEHLTELMRLKDTGQMNPGSMYEVNIDADPNAFLDWDKPLSEQPEAVQKAYNKTLKGSLVTREIGNNENFGPLTDVSVPGGGSLGVFTKDQLPDVLENPAKYAPLTGGGLYSSLVENHHLNVNPPTPFLQSKAKATEKLKAQGIPGIKYLDAGSRGAGDGTRNYVVFDDKLISIVKKYGIAGASAMLGHDVLTGANEAQAKAVNKADLDHRYDNFLKSGGI